MGLLGNITVVDESIFQKYESERQRRLRGDGLDQYVDVSKSDEMQHYSEDP